MALLLFFQQRLHWDTQVQYELKANGIKTETGLAVLVEKRLILRLGR